MVDEDRLVLIIVGDMDFAHVRVIAQLYYCAVALPFFAVADLHGLHCSDVYC
jgi:hypothetical protein